MRQGIFLPESIFNAHSLTCVRTFQCDLLMTFSCFCTEGQRNRRSTGGDVVHLVRASDRHAADAGSIPRCGKEFFSQGQRSVQTLTCVRTPPCAIACINICAHVKDPVVHVRVRWIMETLKHPACTIGWITRLCRSWLSPRKATRISHGRKPTGTVQNNKNKVK